MYANVSSRVTVVIVTYNRERILLDTLRYILELKPGPAELLVVDQTKTHHAATNDKLTSLEKNGDICWIRLPSPSITRAMNIGLQKAQHEIVLFLDDDVVPDNDLIAGHIRAHEESNIVGGQVLQPGETALAKTEESMPFRFCSNTKQWIGEVIGCNFSVKRSLALTLGGFDENFVRVAYRFEAEFCDRAVAAGERILFEPRASIRHLKANRGGTRAYGRHLTTIKPSHAVGEYYYLMRSRKVQYRFVKMILRFFRSVRTKHHLLRPWWIPVTLFAEVSGFCWAIFLTLQKPRLLGQKEKNDR